MPTPPELAPAITLPVAYDSVTVAELIPIKPPMARVEVLPVTEPLAYAYVTVPLLIPTKPPIASVPAAELTLATL